ncbi:hypothetical protein NQ314_000179, partial [Rhamnusium bicolor]
GFHKKAMPAGKDSDSANSSNAAQRTTFRPPWVKDGPNPLPTPAAPWTLNKTNNRRDTGVQLRKTTIQTKEPQENGSKESFFKKPALKPVPQREKTPPKKDYKLHNLPQLQKASERVLKSRPSVTKDDSFESEEEDDIDRKIVYLGNTDEEKRSGQRGFYEKIVPIEYSGTSTTTRHASPPPMMPGEVPKKKLNESQKARLDKLRSRPKNRPDWNNLLQEIESKKKLKHVVCNDRSQPLLPEAKAPDEHFLYKSEEPNIEGGIKLKKVKTNDRSKPILDGLRKFRRQMTIEEQIQKSMSMASIPPEEITDEIDEMDDIDKVRDDLQSTKQMLALELRNKEAQERENKRLLARLQNLEAELEKEKSKNKAAGNTGSGNNAADEKIIKSLKTEVEGARKSSQELEKKYTQATEELDSTKAQLEEIRRQNQMLEKRLQEAALGKRQSITDGKRNMTKEESDEDFEDEDTEEESDGEDTEEKREKKAQKELKILVDKMASLMKDADEEEEEEEEEEKEAEEEESEEEEETSEEEESESDSDDSDSERSQSEDEDAPIEKKKTNLTARAKRHENILNALKKGNFLLKTNAERLQDELNKQKEMTASLQEDLDSVLSELG